MKVYTPGPPVGLLIETLAAKLRATLFSDIIDEMVRANMFIAGHIKVY